MKIQFCKYQGAGNDFVLIDNRDNSVNLNQQQINQLCDRRFGIGADGLMFLEQDNSLDFRMRYYNSDGREGTMCGNGGRCIVAFAKCLGIQREKYIFTAIDGIHEAYLDDDSVDLLMSPVDKIEKVDNEWFLDTGSPHVVKVVDALDVYDVDKKGSFLRYDRRFGELGSNVNFMELYSDKIKLRTYERGVEAETLACGTGAVASAIVAHQYASGRRFFVVEARGGILEVRFDKQENTYSNIWLKGPVQLVFEGVINI